MLSLFLVYFHFHLSQNVFFSFDLSFDTMAAQECLISTHSWIFQSFCFFDLYFFTILVRKDTGCDLSLKKFLSLFVLWNLIMICLGDYSSCSWEECVSGAAGLNVVGMTVRSKGANRQFKSSISILIFCLDDLSVVQSGEWSPWLLLCHCLFLASEL